MRYASIWAAVIVGDGEEEGDMETSSELDLGRIVD